VAPVGGERQARQIDGGAFDDKRTVLFLAVITFVALCGNGYRFAYSDQTLYIPFIERAIHPEAFPKDYLLDLLSGNTTLWVPAVAFLARRLDLQWTFFIGHLVSLFGLLVAVYVLAFVLFRNRSAAVLAVLLVVPFQSVFETRINTFEKYFSMRATAMPLAIGSVAAFAAGRWNLAALLGGLCFLLHPITAVGPVTALFLYLFSRGRDLGWDTAFKALAVFLVVSVPLLVQVVTGNAGLGDSLLARPGSEWMAIVRGRQPYIFYSRWSGWDTWGHLVNYLALFALGVAVKMRATVERSRDWRSVWIVACALLWFGIGYLFVEVHPLSLIMQMQPARTLYLLVYLALVYAAHVLWLTLGRAKASTLERVLIVAGAVVLFHAEKSSVLMSGALVASLLWLPLIDWSHTHDNAARATRYRLIVRGVLVLLLGVLLWRFWELLQRPVYASLASAVLPLFLLLEGIRRVSPFGGRTLQAALRVGILPALALVVLVVIAHPRLGAAFNQEQLRQHLQLPHRLHRSPWRDVQQWVARNTASDAVFLVPPNESGFRVFARRSSVGDHKDGAASVFSERFARTWLARMTDLYDYENFDEGEWLRLASAYQAYFVVTRSGHALSFDRLYDNGTFSVYRIPEDARNRYTPPQDTVALVHVSPNSVAPGLIRVILTGTGFQSGAVVDVFYGGTPILAGTVLAGAIPSATRTRIEAVLQILLTGTFDLRVRNPNGGRSNKLTLTVG
jgi:hypothetical protein